MIEEVRRFRCFPLDFLKSSFFSREESEGFMPGRSAVKAKSRESSVQLSVSPQTIRVTGAPQKIHSHVFASNLKIMGRFFHLMRQPFPDRRVCLIIPVVAGASPAATHPLCPGRCHLGE